MNFARLVCTLISVSVAFGFKLKSYKKAKVQYETELQNLPAKSVIGCLSFCANRIQCIGAKFKDSQCKLFKDLKLSQNEGIEAMVDTETIEFERSRNYGKILISGGQHTGESTVFDLETRTECESMQPLSTSRLDVPIGQISY